ncbi:tetratricopeptide repeat protein [Streptomyces sp. NPDC054784]
MYIQEWENARKSPTPMMLSSKGSRFRAGLIIIARIGFGRARVERWFPHRLRAILVRESMPPEAPVKLRIRMLGPVELRAGMQHSALGSAKERLTLAALAWDVGKAVSADVLIHRVWEDDQLPAKPRDSLYTYVSRIRNALRSMGGADAPVLSGRTQTYCLEATPDTVDLRCYTGLVDRARTTLRVAGRSREALDLLEEAAGLWGGEPLAGMSGRWAGHAREAIAERHLEAVLLRAEAAVRLGRYAETVSDLAPLVDTHAHNELLVEQLVLALYASGRVDEASRTMQGALRTMSREHGITPGPRLRRVHEGILTGLPMADLLPTEASALREPAPVVPDNLPSDVVWVGRQEELRYLSGGIGGKPPTDEGNSSVRLSATAYVRTIDGMGASGKTALAVHLAYAFRDQFPSARLFLNLRAHAPYQEPLDTTAALTALLRALGHSGTEIPRDTAELTTMWRTEMATLRAIVILDDATGPEQVRPLLPGSSYSLILVTSRHRLTGLPQSRSLSLGELRTEDAVRLFHERIGSGRVSNAADATEIVRLCGRLPLAVEMAASRLQSRPSWQTSDLRRLFARKPRRLPELRDGTRQLTEVFTASYDELSGVQQLVFRRLGLHVGAEFGVGAAAALADLPEDETDRALEQLHAQHLVVEPTPHRYRLHDLLREFAVSRADAEGEGVRRQSLRRLLGSYLSAADEADRRAYPQRFRFDVPVEPRPDTASPWGDSSPNQWFVTEGANLLALAEYTRRHESSHDLALLAHVLSGYLDAEGYLATAGSLLREAVAHWAESGDRPAEARALLDLTTVLIHMGDYREASLASGKVRALAEASHDEELTAEALHQISIVQWHTGHFREALGIQKASLDIRNRAESSSLHQARGFNVMGILLLHLGRPAEALENFLEALPRFRDADYISGQYKTMNNIAELQQQIGDAREAIQTYRQAMGLARVAGRRAETATLQMNLASVELSAGDKAEALALYEGALMVFRGAGDKRNEAISLNGIGAVMQVTGRWQEAIPHHQMALDLAREIDAASEQAQALRLLGTAERAAGLLEPAVGHLKESLAVARRMQAPVEEAEALAALNEVHRPQA